jgi:hypothetical protein
MTGTPPDQQPPQGTPPGGPPAGQPAGPPPRQPQSQQPPQGPPPQQGPPPGGPGGFGPGPGGPGWQAPQPSPRKGSPGKAIAIVAIVFVLVAGGIVGVYFGFLREEGHPTSGREGTSLDAGPTTFSVDEVRKPPQEPNDAGDAGSYGKQLKAALVSAGFACKRLNGLGKSAQDVCYRRDDSPVPTVQTVGVSIVGGQVVRVVGRVQYDPGWDSLGSNADARVVEREVFHLLIESSIPDGERPTASRALSTAGQDDEPTSEATLSSGKVVFNVGKLEGSFSFTRKAPGTMSVSNGMQYVTPKELQSVAESNGFTCSREDQELNCTKGKATVRVVFPRKPYQPAYVESIGISSNGDAPGSISGVAQGVAKLVGDKYDEGGDASSWVAGCFGKYSNQATYAHTQFTCSPDLSGSPKNPTIAGQKLAIEAVNV